MDKNDDVEVRGLIKVLMQNFEKIIQAGNRVYYLLKGMLLHSTGVMEEKILVDIHELLDLFVMLASHGLRTQNIEFNLAIRNDYDRSIEKIIIVPQDFSRVFLNIINNACYATSEKNQVMDLLPYLIFQQKIIKGNLKSELMIMEMVKALACR
jgi:nitrogen-specific signal transduction histidine kinase